MKLIKIYIKQTLDVIIRKRLMAIQCKSRERPDIKQNNNYIHMDFWKKFKCIYWYLWILGREIPT